jgi:hypothetical protein
VIFELFTQPFKKFGYWWFRYKREVCGPYGSYDHAALALENKRAGVKFEVANEA